MKKRGLLLLILLISVSAVWAGAEYVKRFYLVQQASIEVVGSSYEIGLFLDADMTEAFDGVVEFGEMQVLDLYENVTSGVSQILFVGLVSPEALDGGESVYIQWVGDIDGELPSTVSLACDEWNTGGWVDFPEGVYDIQLSSANPSKGIRFKVDVGDTPQGGYAFKIRIEAAENTG